MVFKIVSTNTHELLSLGRTVALAFDTKTDSEIVFQGHVIMNDSESAYIYALIEQFQDKAIEHVLEVGYGLGISANFIQSLLSPKTHDIYEIEQSIFDDCQVFSKNMKGVFPYFQDFYTVDHSLLAEKYDLFFDDSYDYNFPLNGIGADKSEEETYLHEKHGMSYQEYVDYCFEKSRKIALQVLKKGGYYCTVYFGDHPPALEGFEIVKNAVRNEQNLQLWDKSVGTAAQVFYYRKL